MKNDKQLHILILVRVEDKNDKVGIQSRSATQAYRDNFDTVFGNKQESNTLN
jgi:hypothetical protein